MANNAMALESDLADATCQLCNELYTDPLLLPCLHSYCKKCLVKFNEKQDVSDGSITCPSCDQVSKIPSNGVVAFPQNLWLAHHVEEERCKEKLSSGDDIPCERCVPTEQPSTTAAAVVFCCECCEFLCTTCKKDHQRWRKTVNHELMEVGEKKKKKTTNKTPKIPRKEQYCSQHADEKLKFYCQNCEEITCRDCLILNHKEHPYGYYDKVAEKGRIDLETSLQGCDEVITVLDNDIGNGEKMIQCIKSRKKAVDKEINDVFDILQNAVEARRRVLLNESEEVALGKVAAISIQAEGFLRLKNQTSYGRKFANNALSTHQSNELLSTKKVIEGQLERCKSNFKKLPRHLLENDYMQLSLEYSSIVDDTIMKFGALLVANPALCVIQAGAAVPFASVGKERKFQLSLKDTLGADVTGSVAIQGNLVVLESGRRIPVTISTEGGPSKPTLTFTPDTAGEHELSIMVTGTHVQGSPYRMWVRQERELSSMSTSAQTYFQVGNNTYGVAVHHNGYVYCSNYSNNYVQVLDENNSKKLTIGSSGSGNGQLSSPWGLAIVGDILYVADRSNHRVQRFTLTGEYIGQFGSNGSRDGQFSYPRGITHDGRGHVIVADENNHRIQIFQLDGVHVRSIPCDGSDVYGVAVDNNGNIHVPLYSKNIVQVYSFEGDELASYSDKGGDFYNPCDIFIDDNGYRYITTVNSSYYYLHILDTKGERVKLISVHSPWAITLDTEGYIYVAEYSNSRVSKY